MAIIKNDDMGTTILENLENMIKSSTFECECVENQIKELFTLRTIAAKRLVRFEGSDDAYKEAINTYNYINDLLRKILLL